MTTRSPSLAQRSWGPSIVLSLRSLSPCPFLLSLSQSSLESLSSSLLRSYPRVSLFRSFCCSLSPCQPLLPFPPWTLCYWLELCEEINRDPAPRTSSDAVEEDKGTHPDVPLALLPVPYDTYIYVHMYVRICIYVRNSVSVSDANFVRKMRGGI